MPDHLASMAYLWWGIGTHKPQLWIFDFMIWNKETKKLGGKPRRAGKGGDPGRVLPIHCKLSHSPGLTPATGG